MFRPQTVVVIRPDDDCLRSKHVAFTLNTTVVLDLCYFDCKKTNHELPACEQNREVSCSLNISTSGLYLLLFFTDFVALLCVGVCFASFQDPLIS
jgi:hypothetical protein